MAGKKGTMVIVRSDRTAMSFASYWDKTFRLNRFEQTPRVRGDILM